MKKIYTPFIISSFLFSGVELFSQNIAINTTGATGNCNTLLDLNTGNTFSGANNGRGLLIPNLNLATTADISMFPTGTCAVPQSTLIYNTNNAITGIGAAGIGYYYYDTGTSRWINLVDNLAPGSAWMLAGNTNITTPAAPGTYGTSTIAAGENWMGTTDAQDIVFGTSNIERMRIDKTTGSVAIGSSSPNANRTLYSLYTGTTATGAGIWGSASGNAKVYGVFGSISSITTDAAAIRGISSGVSGASVAVYGENQSADGFGVSGINTYGAGAGNLEYGVYGSKQGAAVTGTGYGVYGTATGTGAANIGGYFKASGATNNYGIIVPSGGGLVGVGTSLPTNMVHVVSTNSSYDGVYANHTSGTAGSAYSAVNGQTNGAGYTAAQGFLGYHNSFNNTFSVYGNGGDLAGMFNGKVGVNSVSTNLTSSDIEVRNNVAGANPVNIFLRQSTSNTLINSILGNLDFGDDYNTSAQARIQVLRDAASGAGTDLPTAITFWNIADGSSVLTERLRITSAGALALNGAANYGTAGQVLTSNGNAPPTWAAAAGGGTVTSVGGTAPIVSSGGNTPVISLQGTAGGVVYGAGAGSGVSAAGTAGQVLISGGAGAPTWSNRLITNETANPWKVFYSNAAGTVTELALPVAGQVLTSTGVAAAPVWSAGGTGTIIYIGGCTTAISTFGVVTQNPVSACFNYALAANTYTNILTKAYVGLANTTGLASSATFTLYYAGLAKQVLTVANTSLNATTFASFSFIGPNAGGAGNNISIGMGAGIGNSTWTVYYMEVYGIK